MQQVSLSTYTIQRRISKMSMDVKEQVLDEIKASPLFSFQLWGFQKGNSLYFTSKMKHVMKGLCTYVGT